ncbi:GNAT family N-acetyltransferase [Candidatus Woesearchaeota archaeon]|jgi:GNAT superfamily N-acetyltransferase|nr:GNAT family N-acetyltransferase [Candidatus Woesearchaeota archaeon]MBT4387035.1 GNAT family N-acetyltransferase [Candidatus Woesearchaeota archaeon]MBT4595915.1 GNAT family N-acetyltransferase [Candidatus Woesearchaeota archaeon]MBT5741045.1 GNAT family N-acetyltransferase [Candidatus Woesearchaeota archaeon]MBT6505286.1 GNAT family N-acetyltransferase [Candidatus Woesearchaeota archaeon]
MDTNIIDYKGKNFQEYEIFRPRGIHLYHLANMNGNRVGIANLEYSKCFDWFFFNRLFIDDDFRGQGFANLILKKVIGKANEHQYKIYNQAVPYDESLNLEQLMTFYKKHGFKTIKENLMIFEPEIKKPNYDLQQSLTLNP